MKSINSRTHNFSINHARAEGGEERRYAHGHTVTRRLSNPKYPKALSPAPVIAAFVARAEAARGQIRAPLSRN